MVRRNSIRLAISLSQEAKGSCDRCRRHRGRFWRGGPRGSALTAAEAGATVLVAEAEDVVGGSSRLSGASLVGAGSKLQAQLGIEDSPERLYHYYMTLNHWSTEPALGWQLANGVGPVGDWLCELGIEFDPKLYRAGEEDVPRKHVPLGGGEQIIAVLQERVQQAGGDIALRRRVDRLLLDDAGELVGAAVGDDEVTAHAVVVTTGGFGANSELIERYLPQTADVGDWLWYIGAPGSRGDALILGEQVGAQIAGEDLCQLMLTPNFGNLLEGGYFPGWLVLVNASGRRFFDESSSFSVTQPIVRAQKGPVWAIFDRGAKDAAAPATAGQRKRPDAKERDYYFKKWVTPVLDEMIDKGVVLHAQTAEELAGLIGVPERNLAGTIERYNADFDAGADQMFFKSHALMRASATRRITRPSFGSLTSPSRRRACVSTPERMSWTKQALPSPGSSPQASALAASSARSTSGTGMRTPTRSSLAASPALRQRKPRGRCISRLGSPKKIPKIAPRSMDPTKSRGFRF